MLLDITQGAIDNHAGGTKVFCAKRHQATVAGVNVRHGLGDEDDGVFRDLVDLNSGVSIPAYRREITGIRSRHKRSCPAPSGRFCPPWERI